MQKKLNPAKIKERIMKIGVKTGCSHIASAMSLVDVLCTHYNARPDDIYIVSKGHGVLAQYVVLNELGKLPDKVLETYYQNGGLSLHSTLMPEYGVYASTGSLGHGLGIGIGYAIANPKTLVVVFMSDGELDCGSTLESLRIIQKLKLKNILPVIDHNGWQAFSQFDESTMDFMYKKFYSVKGEGWGKLENTLESHYTKVDKKLFKIWEENFPQIEKRRIEQARDNKTSS